MNKTTILKPLEFLINLPFSKKNTCNKQQFVLKDFKVDENITFFEIFNLHLDEKTSIYEGR
jgi:hypothetical protein